MTGVGSNSNSPSSNVPSTISIAQGGIGMSPKQPQLERFPWTHSPMRIRQKMLSTKIAIGRASREIISITITANSSSAISVASR
jgi:hypothetical protein